MTAHPVRVAFAPRQVRTTKRKLLWSCAAAAILVTAGTTAQKARAQAFQGTPTLPNPNIAVSGSATRTITSPTAETITVGSPTATINWIPSDNDGSGTIDFLPNGNVATFINDPNTTADYTVLNRILPAQTRPIGLNGTVISQLQDLSENVSTGGHVWFYSPNGIIVGATAVFNVGSLLLTVNDPVSFSTSANGFTGQFVASPDSTASVTIDPGAKITASPENSYVALVAPRVVQGGEVGVNGSAAYVAGEDVTLTMNQGLFDIQVNVGTSDPNNPDNGSGVVHTGTTGGPASTGAGDNHRIYMVAVPKNQALTMLLSGNVGFTPASSATLDNGTIVLAAGSYVSETTGTLIVSSPNGINADLELGPGNYTSDVIGFARGDIDVTADDGFMTFSRNLALTSLLAAETGRVSVGASGGYILSVGGDLDLQTSGATFTSGAPEEINLLVDGGTVTVGGNLTAIAGAAADGTLGDVEIAVQDVSENHGSLTVTGTTLISTSAGAAGINPDADSADGFAGNISIDASNGGSIALGNTFLSASANGQDNNGNGSGFNQGRAGSGFGGNININADNGDITIDGNLSANADGIGGRMLDGGLVGGTGFGGFIELSYFDGGVIHITGNTFLSALGAGGGFIGAGIPASAQGGTGFGGTARITGDGTGFDPGSITIDGDTTIRADGTGGSGQSGGAGFGGSAGINPSDGTIALGPTISVSSRGTGGNASFGFGGNGGDGFGGDAFINALAVPGGVEQFATFATVTGGNATIDATGTGGSGGAGNGDNIAAGSGGAGFGGEPCQGECSSGGASAVASVDGGSLTLGNVTLYAIGAGGAGGTGGAGQTGGVGGDGFGGGIQIGLLEDIFSPTGAPDGVANYGNVVAFASGSGGAGGSSLFQQGDGGTGFGGDVNFLSYASSATAASANLSAIGHGGNGGLVGGDGFGGAITVAADSGHIDVTNALSANADGIGGSANAAGTGGGGFGGDVDLTVNGGRIGFTGGTLSAQGFGGLGYTGGDGFGGEIIASITDLGGLLAMNGNVLLVANGTGGDGFDTPGGTGGTGGTGFGGDVTLSTADTLVPPITSTLQFGNLSLRAHGDGGQGGDGTDGGIGGDGYGGTITTALGETTVTGGDFSIIANGNGGDGGAGTATGGAGGYGEGGVNSLNLGSAGSINAATYGSLLDGFGGAGGAGGTAQGDGGDALGGTNSATIEGDATFGGVIAVSGFVVTTYAEGGAGLFGGSAQAGTSSILVNGTLHVASLVQSTARATGGNGGTNGGDGFGGTATVMVNGDLTGGRLLNSTDATGGSGSAAGGFAQGGHSLFELPAGTGTATFSSSTVVSASGTGGNSSAGTGGDGSGGDAHVKAHDGTHISAANLSLAADGFGGNGVTGGQGEGGFVEAIALQEGALLTLTGQAIISASGYGGDGTIAGTGGSGFGGTAGLYAGIDDNPDTPLVGGTVTAVNAIVRSLGQGGDGGLGGDGTGGLSQVGTRYGTLTVTGTLFGDAGAAGGNSLAGIGGTGNGGTFQVTANFAGDTGPGTVNLGTADLWAVGVGGNGGGSGNAGGTGFGGLVQVLSPTAGSTLTATALSLHAGADGGLGGNGALGGRGGDANGGHALIDIAAGTANLGAVSSFARGVAGNGGTGSSDAGGAGGNGSAGNVELNVTGILNGTSYSGDARANGGNGGAGTVAGIGGFGHGGSASIDVFGGDATFTGTVILTAWGLGGAGSTGGDGIGGASTLTIDGTGSLAAANLFLDADAFGGAGLAGAGGDAIANFARIANSGDLTVIGETFVSAEGEGGDGTTAGGGGFGSDASIITFSGGNSALGTETTVGADGTGGSATTGEGGEGVGGLAVFRVFGGGTATGANLTATADGDGGAGATGGDGQGGFFAGEGSGGAFISATGTGATLTLTGMATAHANGFGGNATAGTRGDGDGGLANIGAFNGGAVSVAGIHIESNGIGGTGLGADSGTGGTSTLTAEGGTLTAGSATVLSHGSAEGGEVFIFSGPYFGSGSGELTLGSLTAAANGASAGDIFVTVNNGSFADLGVASLSTTGVGGSIVIELGAEPLLLLGGIGTFGLSNTLLTADSLNLNTGGTIDITSFNGASIDVAGLFHANAGGAMTLDDIDDTAVVRADIIDFHADSFASTFDILGRVIGIFTVQDLDVTSTVLLADEILTLQSDADVIAGDLSAGLEINLFAGGDITTGDLDSGGTIVADAFGGIQLGNLNSIGETNLDANGNIVFLNADVGSIDFSTDGSVQGGNIVAVTEVNGDAGGAVTLGNITVGPGPEGVDDFSVGIASATSILVGDVQSYGRVAFATLGDLTTGNITAGPLFMALVSGDVTVGSVTTAPTGQVYIADSSMFLAAGGVEDFDVSLVLPLAPLPTGGSITITGPVSTGQFQAAAGVDFTSGAIAATGDVEIVAINDLSTANITAGGLVDLLSDGTGGLGNIVFGDVSADVLKFSADGTVTGGDIHAVTKVTGDAEGAIALGDITVTGPEAGGDFSVGIGSETSIDVGNVSAVGRVGFATFGDLNTGNITAGPLFMALVSGDVTVGSVTTAPTGQVYIADSSMFLAAGGTDDFDASLVLPLAPVATGGSITFGGPVSTGRFQAAAGDSLTAGNITAASSIDASAGDNITTGNLTFGQSVTLNAGNNIVAGDLDGGHNVAFTAGNNLAVGDVDADGTATFTAVGLASFLGVVGVPTITVTSSDINVPFGGSLGVWGTTNLVTLNAVSANPIIIGSTGAAAAAAAVPQYVLDEDGEINGATVVINAVGANGGPDPDIIVHNVGIDGSLASDPSVSHVVVNTDASVLIDGLVLFTGASATDSLAINAGDSIQVNTTDGGGIAMVNTAEDRPSGLLTLTSDNIWAGSGSLLDQLNTNVNFVGRDALIGTNPGVEVPEGYLIAGGMTLSLADTLFVQNTGAGQAYAGITVGAGGLTVATTGAAPAQVVAYGRRMNPDGTFVTGNQFFALVNFTKATSLYTAQSEFNECLINTGCFGGGGAVGGGTLGPEAILGPVDLMGNPEETIEWAASEDEGQAGSDGEAGEDGVEGGEGSVDWSSQLFGTGGLSDEALVDEGVTSGGDNNQWDSQVCKPTSPDQPCPETAPPAAKQEQ